MVGHGGEGIKEGVILGSESRRVRLLARISVRMPGMRDASTDQVFSFFSFIPSGPSTHGKVPGVSRVVFHLQRILF